MKKDGAGSWREKRRKRKPSDPVIMMLYNQSIECPSSQVHPVSHYCGRHPGREGGCAGVQMRDDAHCSLTSFPSLPGRDRRVGPLQSLDTDREGRVGGSMPSMDRSSEGRSGFTAHTLTSKGRIDDDGEGKEARLHAKQARSFLTVSQCMSTPCI